MWGAGKAARGANRGTSGGWKITKGQGCRATFQLGGDVRVIVMEKLYDDSKHIRLIKEAGWIRKFKTSAGTAQLVCTFVSATRMVELLFFLFLKFQASSAI